MPPRHDAAYDDEPSEEELKLLEEHSRSGEVPEPDDSSQAPLPDENEDVDEGEPKPKPKPAEEQEPVPDKDGKLPGDEEEADAGKTRLSDFLAKHQGKTPEQLVELAFQQSQRANRAEFDHRKTTENLSGVLTRIQAARDARVDAVAKQREEFAKKVADDPDAALLEARESQITRENDAELARLDAAEFDARAGAAIEMAAGVIPNFAEKAPQIRQFGLEMGFTPQEVGAIVDGRQIVTLYLARMAGNLIRAGVMDTSGKFVGLPEPVVEGEQEQEQGGQRRGTGFGKLPARGAQGAKTLDARLAEINAMSDDDFDKLDPRELDKLLKEVEQA